MEIPNTQNDYETMSKKWTDKKKTNLFCEFCKSVYIPRKLVQDCSKEFLGNSNKKDFLETHWSLWSLHDTYGRSKAEDWQVIDRWPALICSPALSFPFNAK